MNRLLLVFHRDLKEMRSTAAFHIILAVTAVITLAASVGISVALRLQSWYGAPEAAPILNLIFGLVAYFLPLFIIITFIWVFASFPIISEKVNGNIECLLATPLSPTELWLGKGLAVFLPGYVISVIATCIVLLTLNFVVAQPGWDKFILPAASGVNGLIVNPLLFFSMVSFIVLFSLADNPDVAIAPSFLIGFGLMIGVPVGLMTGTFDITSWSFTLWYLGITVIAWAVVAFLTRRLTRQNIVLSSKGS